MDGVSISPLELILILAFLLLKVELLSVVVGASEACSIFCRRHKQQPLLQLDPVL